MIRHAEATGQAPQAPLSHEGHRQAEALVGVLEALGVDAAIASPFRRAQETILPFAFHADLIVQQDADLRERVLAPAPQDNWLALLERSYDDVDFALEGGESLRDTQRRGLAAIARAAACSARLPALVSHGQLIASVLHAIDPAFGFSQWRAMRNPDIFEIDWDGVAPTRFSRIDADGAAFG